MTALDEIGSASGSGCMELMECSEGSESKNTILSSYL